MGEYLKWREAGEPRHEIVVKSSVAPRGLRVGSGQVMGLD